MNDIEKTPDTPKGKHKGLLFLLLCFVLPLLALIGLVMLSDLLQ